MPPTLALARKARDANKKLLEKAHLTYTAMVKRRGKDVPAVIAFSSRGRTRWSFQTFSASDARAFRSW